LDWRDPSAMGTAATTVTTNAGSTPVKLKPEVMLSSFMVSYFCRFVARSYFPHGPRLFAVLTKVTVTAVEGVLFADFLTTKRAVHLFFVGFEIFFYFLFQGRFHLAVEHWSHHASYCTGFALLPKLS